MQGLDKNYPATTAAHSNQENHPFLPMELVQKVGQLSMTGFAEQVAKGTLNFLPDPDVNDRDLQYIVNYSGKIRFLNIDGSRVTGEGLVESFFVKEGLSSKLTTLEGFCAIGVPCTAGMQKFYHLLAKTSHDVKELWLNGSSGVMKSVIENELISLLLANPRLQVLKLEGFVVSAELIQVLRQSSLIDLKLNQCDILPGSFDLFHQLSVQALNLCDCRGITDSLLQSIAASNSLTEFFMGLLSAPKQALDSLKTCPELARLGLIGCENLEGQWSLLKEFKKLEEVIIDKETLSAEVSSVIVELQQRSPPVFWKITIEEESQIDESGEDSQDDNDTISLTSEK